MLRAWKVAFIGVLVAIIPEQTSVLWAQDARDDQTKPAQDTKEQQPKPAQDIKDDQTKPAQDTKGDQTKPAQNANPEQTKPAQDAKEDQTKPAQGAKEDQTKASQDTKGDQTKPALNAKGDQTKPAQDIKEEPTKATPEANGDESKATEQNATYSGKVLVVDREAKTVTVEIQKRLYLLKLSSASRILREGKKVSINEVITGQEISVQLAEGPAGEVLVTRLFIGPPSEGLEAAGNGSSGATPADPGVSPAIPATPYNGSPNRPPVSPFN